MSYWFRSVFVSCLLAVSQATVYTPLQARQPQASLDNIALGKPYAFNRPANYRLCQDADDRLQLTDGQFTKGLFWNQKSTVGWRGWQPVLISIDLGSVQPIRGVALSTAAGRAGVQWPDVLMLMVSDDGKQWYSVGNVVQLSAKHGTQPDIGYGTHVYRAKELKTYGRYVQIGVVPMGRFLFLDEIEIYAGNQEFLVSDRGPTWDDPVAILKASRVTHYLGSQLRTDLDTVRWNIASDATPQPTKAMLLAEVARLRRRVNQLPAKVRPGFKAILPMNDLEREIFALQAKVWREQGSDTIRIWKNHRWDMIGPSEEPPVEAEHAKIRVDLLNGEHRADVLNITVADSEPVEVRVRIEGLPSGINPEYVTPYEVHCVGTRHLGAISSPLSPMKRQGDTFVMTIVPGMTRQIWLDFHPENLPPGLHRGHVSLQYNSDAKQSLPIELTVWPQEFPEQTSLSLGGWSYTNIKRNRGITEKNRKALIEFLQDYHVNSPWATRTALPEGNYDDLGNLTQSPDTTNFDAWVKHWPEAKRYMVFFAVGGYSTVTRSTFAGSEPGTKLFAKKLTSWSHFWANHMRELGLQPNQLGLCLFDEPVEKKQFDLITLWNRPIKHAEPDIVVMVNPVFKIQDETYLQMMADMDLLVPNRRAWYEYADWYPDLFAKQRREGRDLGLYSCGAPARSFDPYAHYLLQAWHTFHIGGVWNGYWSFGDTRSADPWNDYSASSSGSYTPFYLLETDVMTDKRMEAIREGAQDYEYLVLLREQVKYLEATDHTSKTLSEARELLDSACEQVLIGFEKTEFRWDAPADRTVVDRIRVDILTALSKLDGKKHQLQSK